MTSPLSCLGLPDKQYLGYHVRDRRVRPQVEKHQWSHPACAPTPKRRWDSSWAGDYHWFVLGLQTWPLTDLPQEGAPALLCVLQMKKSWSHQNDLFTDIYFYCTKYHNNISFSSDVRVIRVIDKKTPKPNEMSVFCKAEFCTSTNHV